MRNLLFIVLTLSLFSCEKAELPKPFSANNNSSATVSVSMGANYETQLFYNLASRSVIKTVARDCWDLGFGTDADGLRIILNGAKLMNVSLTTATELSQVTSQSGASWRYDVSRGMTDSLALNGWEINRVYLVDRGINTAGSQIGKIKFKITAHDADSFTIEWGKIPATSGFTTAVIQKNTNYNYVFYSFTGTGAVVDVEPPKNDWDITFTSYTYIFYEDVVTPYLVNGVLSNINSAQTFQTTDSFDDIDLADAVAYNYSSELDIIGYDWKTYDFGAEIYVIDFNKHYVIKSIDGNYYKLRFLDFYDANGVKGAPSFELVKL